MTTAVKPSLQVHPMYQNDKGIFGYEAISNAFQTKASELSTPLIWAANSYFLPEDFAITKLTELAGNVEYIDSLDYEYPIMSGDIDPMDTVVSASTTTNAGLNTTKFIVTFKHRRFKFQNLVTSASKVQCQVKAQPEPNGKYWDYVLEIMGNNNLATVPASDLAAGALWERGATPVEFEESVGTESEEQYPSRAKNQINTLRASMKWAGHIAVHPIAGKSSAQFDKVAFDVPMKLKSGGAKTFKYWMHWKEWQFLLKKLRYKEVDYWTSEYNRYPDGTIANRGPSGKAILRGDGILNQITNRDYYSGKLTAQRFEEIATELFYGMSGAEKKHLQLHTGTLGMRIFNDAMQHQLKSYFTTEQTQNVFVTKSGDMLTLGAYFNTYKTRDGHTITVHRNPVFDWIYRNSPKYMGLPSFSGEFVFLDMSTYNGVANFRKVTRKGREMNYGIVAGMATLPAEYGNTLYKASDKDIASIEYIWEQGIQIYDTSYCYRLGLNI